MSEHLTKRVLVIGWDGADWKHIQPLLEKGWMPHLKQFMDRGAWGNLATLHPVELRDELAELRVHPAELTQHDLGPFIPNLAKIDQQKDRRLEMVAYLVAEMASVHAAVTHVVEKNDWDFMAVYYDSVDHFCHGFMRYHPPRMANVRDEDFEIYKDVVTGCYRFHDLMLGRLLQLAGEDATVIVCSDHGFHSDHLLRAEKAEPRLPGLHNRLG